MGVEAVSTQEARPGPSFGDPGNECNYPRYIMLHERKPQKTSAVECILASGLGASKGQSKKKHIYYGQGAKLPAIGGGRLHLQRQASSFELRVPLKERSYPRCTTTEHARTRAKACLKHTSIRRSTLICRSQGGQVPGYLNIHLSRCSLNRPSGRIYSNQPRGPPPAGGYGRI